MRVPESQQMKEASVNIKAVYLLLCCACACAGCGAPELGVTHQECESLMIGKYEVIAPSGEQAPYKDLEIMSNNVFSCSCRVNGGWVGVTGVWKLSQDNRTTKKSEDLSPTNRGQCYICFSCMLNETGRERHVCTPFVVDKYNGKNRITIDDDLGTSFEKIIDPKKHTEK